MVQKVVRQDCGKAVWKPSISQCLSAAAGGASCQSSQRAARPTAFAESRSVRHSTWHGNCVGRSIHHVNRRHQSRGVHALKGQLCPLMFEGCSALLCDADSR